MSKVDLTEETLAWMKAEGFVPRRVKRSGESLHLEFEYRGLVFHLQLERVWTDFYAKVGWTRIDFQEDGILRGGEFERIRTVVERAKQSSQWSRVERTFAGKNAVVQAKPKAVDDAQQAVYELDAVLQRYGLKAGNLWILTKHNRGSRRTS